MRVVGLFSSSTAEVLSNISAGSERGCITYESDLPLKVTTRLQLTSPALPGSQTDAIVAAPCGFDLHERTSRYVRSGSVLAIDGHAYMNRPGPRLVDTAEIMARAIAKWPRRAAP